MDPSPVVGVRAILFTDMVGSTELRSQLGDDRADDLRRDHDALIGDAVRGNGGEVLRWTGDGVKAAFGSASAAVSAGIDMQRAVTRYGRRADAVVAFEIRIGISVGEVSTEDGDHHGVAVIEAARLEPMAPPGGILATDLVQRLGQRRADATFEEVGTHTLKGLDHPVTVVQVIDTAVDTDVRPVPKALALDERFPLVGRAADLETAGRAWSDALAGTATTVLVAGRPGIGKSRLMAQVADLAHVEGALVLAGLCDSDLAVPYQPFAAAFADVVDLDSELTAAVADGAGPLGPLFPARTARGDDPGAAARFELFEAVVALLDRLSAGQPVVLVLEDLQWGGPATIQLLRHLVRRGPAIRLLVLASYRSEEIGPGHPLQDLLADVHTEPAVVRVDLGPLDEAAVGALVAARVPGAPDDNVATFAGRVFAESAGSPFFVCELLHHLSSTGELERLVAAGGGADLPLPDSVRDVVGQRLGRLPDDARDLLASAAAIGLTFDLELLATLVGRQIDDVLTVLEGVERVALVQEVDATRFSFTHAIVRTALLEGQSASRVALAHRHIAESIEQLGRPDHDQLAHHWRLAGVEDRAFASLAEAAERDLEALAYESAAERYQELVDYHRRNPSRDLAPLARAWLGLGLALRAQGLVEFLSAIEEAGRLGRRLGDADIVAEAAASTTLPGSFFITAGRPQSGAVELGEDALLLIDADDPRRARILATLAANLAFDPDRDRRVDLIAEASSLARAVGDPELIGSVLVAEYLSLWNPTTFERRDQIRAEVARMARASGDVDLEFYAAFFAAIGTAERGDVAGSRAALDAAVGPASASQNFYFGFLVERLRVSLDVFTGEPDARARVDQLQERYAATHADTSGTWALQVGGLAFQDGSLGELAPALRGMLDDSNLGETWRPPYGLALLVAGDLTGANEVLDQCDDPPLDYFWMTMMQVTSELAVGLDRRDRTEVLFEQLIPYRGQLGITASGSLVYGLVATTLGQLALANDDPALAVEFLTEAVERSRAMGARFEEEKSRRLLAAATAAVSG